MRKEDVFWFLIFAGLVLSGMGLGYYAGSQRSVVAAAAPAAPVCTQINVQRAAPVPPPGKPGARRPLPLCQTDPRTGAVNLPCRLADGRILLPTEIKGGK